MNKIQLLFLSTLSVLFISCEDNPTISISTGSIAGFVKLIAYSTDDTNDLSGFRVSIDSTDLYTLTDSSGRWQIDNVPQGIYNIRYEKVGYTHWMEQSFQFVGNGKAFVNAIYLAKLPTFQILDVLTVINNNDIQVTCKLTDSLLSNSSVHYMRYFIGETSLVDAFTCDYFYHDMVIIPQFSDSVTINIDSSWFDLYGIKSKQKVYVKIYPANPGLPHSYFDNTIGDLVYVNINEKTAKTFEVIVP